MNWLKGLKRFLYNSTKKVLSIKVRGLVNWDPILLTALSDLEVIQSEESSYLWHFKYPIKGTTDSITVATTRPETMLGDTAVAVNPKDKRYKNLIGKRNRIATN